MDFGDNVWDIEWGEPGEYERRPIRPASAASAASGCGASPAPRS